MYTYEHFETNGGKPMLLYVVKTDATMIFAALTGESCLYYLTTIQSQIIKNSFSLRNTN